LILSGVALGLYVGVWFCLIGGITELVDIIKMYNYDSMAIALSIARIICAGLLGSVSGYMLIIPGFIILRNN
jgi:hypothetical protein